MRLVVLDRGHGFGAKILFAFIRLVTRQPTPEMLKLMSYRADFFGKPMKNVTHEAMRGPSAWSVGDRELMAAYISQANASEFCIRAHAAVATRADGDGAKIAATLADLDTAPVGEPLRATLRLLGKLTRDQTVEAEDVHAALAAGATAQQVEDALAVAFAFNIINRLADAFAFSLPGPEAFEVGAKFLLARGYR